MVADLAAGDSDSPPPQAQQPAPQVRSTPSGMVWGVNPVAQPRQQRRSSSESEGFGPVRRQRPAMAVPSFSELRREALAREPEAA